MFVSACVKSGKEGVQKSFATLRNTVKDQDAKTTKRIS
jgi:hypothetical protein